MLHFTKSSTVITLLSFHSDRIASSYAVLSFPGRWKQGFQMLCGRTYSKEVFQSVLPQLYINFVCLQFEVSVTRPRTVAASLDLNLLRTFHPKRKDERTFLKPPPKKYRSRKRRLRSTEVMNEEAAVCPPQDPVSSPLNI